MTKVFTTLALALVVLFAATSCRTAPAALPPEVSVQDDHLASDAAMDAIARMDAALGRGGQASVLPPTVQGRPVLGVLPFTGGTDEEGHIIAGHISNQAALRDAFTVVPRTLALDAIFAEQEFSLSDLTDQDTIDRIETMLNADYVLSGSIRRLGDINLLVLAIIHVGTFEQVAGYYYIYRNLGDVLDSMPSMARSIVDIVMARSTAGLPSLAVVPFTRHPGIEMHYAETLAQILAIEITNSGRYMVLPRLSIIQAALLEQGFQASGYYTDAAGVVSLGRAMRAEYVLSAGAHEISNRYFLMGQILNVEDGSLAIGDSVEYRDIVTEGISMVARLAQLLTDPDAVEGAGVIAATTGTARPQTRAARREWERVQRQWARRQQVSHMAEDAVRNTLETGFFHSWENGGDSRSASGLVLPGLHFSPGPFFAMGLETRMLFQTYTRWGWHGGRQGYHDRTNALFIFSPTVGLVLPLGEQVRIFTNALIELAMGTERFLWQGLISDRVSPGFDVGVEVGLWNWNTVGMIFSAKYRHTWLKNSSANSLGFAIGVGWR